MMAPACRTSCMLTLALRLQRACLPSAGQVRCIASSAAQQDQHQQRQDKQHESDGHRASSSDSGRNSSVSNAPSTPGGEGRSGPQQHWLDRYFPAIRPWLEERNRRYWLKGLIEARPKVRGQGGEEGKPP